MDNIPQTTAPQASMPANAEVLAEVRGRVGFITLNRPKALNALSLGMVRELTAILLRWKGDTDILAIAIRGSNKDGAFGAFCAGGDIRFLHKAGSDGNPELEDFFTEEYQLNYLSHNLGKPYIAFLDGIVMGGGMGISQGSSLRLVTERTKLAMPETGIGLFPDVGGGYFLSRAPGAVGEWLGLTGTTIGGADAVAFGLADGLIPAERQRFIWDGLAGDFANTQAIDAFVRQHFQDAPSAAGAYRSQIDHFFALPTVQTIIDALESDANEWSQHTAQTLRKRSPLMLHVVLEQIRRGRYLELADDLRMERDLVRHAFYLRDNRVHNSETIEGIRALAIDKDQSPQWKPARIEDVDAAEVQAFFTSPWPAVGHPLASLGK